MGLILSNAYQKPVSNALRLGHPLLQGMTGLCVPGEGGGRTINLLSGHQATVDSWGSTRFGCGARKAVWTNEDSRWADPSGQPFTVAVFIQHNVNPNTYHGTVVSRSHWTSSIVNGGWTIYQEYPSQTIWFALRNNNNVVCNSYITPIIGNYYWYILRYRSPATAQTGCAVVEYGKPFSWTRTPTFSGGIGATTGVHSLASSGGNSLQTALAYYFWKRDVSDNELKSLLESPYQMFWGDPIELWTAASNNIYVGTGSTEIQRVVSTGVGTRTIPVYSGIGSVEIQRVVSTGAGTRTIPIYSGVGSVETQRVTAVSTGIFATSIRIGSGSVELQRVSSVGLGTYTVPIYSGIGSVEVQRVVPTGVGTRTVPIYSGAGSVETQRITVTSTGIFATSIRIGSGSVEFRKVMSVGLGTYTQPVYYGEGQVCTTKVVVLGSGTCVQPVYSGFGSVEVQKITSFGSALYGIFYRAQGNLQLQKVLAIGEGRWISAEILESPATILASFLANELAILTVPSLGMAWPVYVDVMPDQPDNVVCVSDSDSRKDGRWMQDGFVQEHNGVDIVLRSVDYLVGWRKCQTILDALESQCNAYVSRDSGQHLIHNVSAISGITSFGQEVGTKRRNLFGMSFLTAITKL